MRKECGKDYGLVPRPPPFFCFSVCIWYNTRKWKGGKKKWGSVVSCGLEADYDRSQKHLLGPFLIHENAQYRYKSNDIIMT